MADGGNALGSMQRLVEERTQQAATAQQALMHLQQDHARLTASLRTAQEQAASRLVSSQKSLSPCIQSEQQFVCITYPGFVALDIPWRRQQGPQELYTATFVNRSV